MTKQGFLIGLVEHGHTDGRRSIYEFNGPDFSVQELVIFEKKPLGNHYHRERKETFYIARGSGKVYLKKPGNHPLHEEAVVEGSVIHVEPGTAHAFVLLPRSTMICVASTPFDAKDVFNCVLVP